MDLSFPYIVGRDMVGVVEAVGPDVTRFAPGDGVWCNNQGYRGRQGTFAEYIAIRQDLLYPLPDGVDQKEFVGFVQSGLTAFIGLERIGLVDGESIFVNGGAGSVGSAVVQLARARGARVIATAGRAEGLKWCQVLGAERTVNYKTDYVDGAVAEFAPAGVDVYWDTSGRPDFDQAVARVARGGRIVVMAGIGTRPPFPVGAFHLKDCSMHGVAITYVGDTKLEKVADEINRWAAEGRMRVRIDRVLRLSETATAHKLVEERVPLNGKIVLTP
jgi:NADPH2:quinone reductase